MAACSGRSCVFEFHFWSCAPRAERFPRTRCAWVRIRFFVCANEKPPRPHVHPLVLELGCTHTRDLCDTFGDRGRVRDSWFLIGVAVFVPGSKSNYTR